MKENEVREGDIVEIDYIEEFTKVHRNEGKAIVIWKDTISHQPLVTKLTEYSPIWRVYDEFSKVVGHISLDSTLKCLVSKNMEKDQSDETPWYLNVFNPTVLKEYQKEIHNASIQDHINIISKEVLYSDEGSSIHGEVYNEEKTMKREKVLIGWDYCEDPNDINIAILNDEWEGLTSVDDIISITFDPNHGCYVVFWKVIN